MYYIYYKNIYTNPFYHDLTDFAIPFEEIIEKSGCFIFPIGRGRRLDVKKEWSNRQNSVTPLTIIYFNFAFFATVA